MLNEKRTGPDVDFQSLQLREHSFKNTVRQAIGDLDLESGFEKYS
jgi:hypothetical protein